MRRGTLPPMGQPQFKSTFIRQWRKRRGLTLEQLAERVGMTPSYLSMLERGKRGYTQETLEAVALTLGTKPGLLLMFDPDHPDQAWWTIWNEASPGERSQLIAVARALKTA